MSFKQYAIVTPGQDLQRREQSLADSIAQLPPDGVLVKVHAAGVCHTDLHQWQEGGYRLSDTEYMLFAERKDFGYPRVPGHEVAGTVHELGKAITETQCALKKGDPVCVYPWIGCGQCTRCHSGQDDFCNGGLSREVGMSIDGGYSEYVSIPHYRYVLPVPSSISLDLAAISGCSCLTAYNAVKTAISVIPRPLLSPPCSLQVAVVGLGGLGSWAIGILPVMFAAVGITPVLTGVDVNQEKLDDFLQAGHIQRSLNLSPSSSPKEKAETCLQETPSGCYNIVIDFVNNPASFDFSFRLLGNGGVLIAVGLFGGAGKVPLPLLALRRKRIIGIQTGSLELLKEVLEFLSSNVEVIKAPNLTMYRLDDCQRALSDMKERKINGRAILKMIP